MTKKYIILGIFAALFLFITPVQAFTYCDDQAKPALDCPTDYSIMCISAGGYHWGCAKESGYGVVEVSSLEAPLLQNETAASVAPDSTSLQKIDATANTLNTKIDLKDAAQDSQRLLPTVNKSTDDNEDLQRVLPTVNKATNESESSERVLPTVNKRTVEAKVTVRGWDPDKKEAITQKIKEKALENPQLNSVDISEDVVQMDYLVPAKLFGLIPWNMPMKVSADANVTVKVKFPWYRFLTTTGFAKASNQINEVFQNNQTDLEFLKSKDSNERQLEIFLKISNTMHEMSKSIIQNVKA
ncbi:MAG: hypothetical protein A2908_00030 [Candidatus Staskawiczbacteria bacterium RIFCSPLOWO2_01_FULL_38_12b]|uniref:Uncharacterized protein n=1 Tax=Candidatus Staskawiczbacteria bacterium RIFCSPLOWO2_01_FULL_38_12b TaxID=1802214 RepID=A0A1G2IDQ7_9BACT|nr:MAG: hypothetical protein A2908_00030 [Candidatus Staskawiczbacteria bacterium RIFCSPLOWO2_01_FULL_38_12b]